MSPTARALGVAAMLVYLVLALPYAARFPAAYDEGVTWRQSLGSISLPTSPAAPVPITHLSPLLDGHGAHGLDGIVAALGSDGGMHPPAHPIFVRAWSAVFGTRRIAARAPLVLLGLVTLFGIGWLAFELVPEPSAPGWAALLLASSPWFVGYSCFLRPYALALCLGVVSTALLVSGLSGRRRAGWPWVFAALGVLGLFTLYHYVFVLVWQGALWLMHAMALPVEQRRPTLARLAAVTLAVALAFTPWLPHFVEQLLGASDGQYYFAGRPPLEAWPALAWRSFELFALGEALRAPIGPTLGIAAGALLIATIAIALRSLSAAAAGPPAALPVRPFWLSLPVLPLGIAVSDFALDSHTLFVTKTTFLALPLGIVAIVSIFSASTPRVLAAAGLSAWAALGVTATATALGSVVTAPTPQTLLARDLARLDRAGHVVALSTSRSGASYPLLHTLREAGVAQSRIVVVEPGALAPTIARLIDDPTVDGVTLIDFDLRGDGRGQLAPLQRERSGRLARARGWRLRESPRFGAGPGGMGPGGAKATLWMPPTLRVKFFAM